MYVCIYIYTHISLSLSDLSLISLSLSLSSRPCRVAAIAAGRQSYSDVQLDNDKPSQDSKSPRASGRSIEREPVQAKRSGNARLKLPTLMIFWPVCVPTDVLSMKLRSYKQCSSEALTSPYTILTHTHTRTKISIFLHPRDNPTITLNFLKNTQSDAFEMVRLKANSMVAPSQPPVPAQAPGKPADGLSQLGLSVLTAHAEAYMRVCEITLRPRELGCTRRTSVQR